MNSTPFQRSIATLLCLSGLATVSPAQNYGYPQQSAPPPQYRQPPQGYPQQGYPQQSQTQYVSPMQFVPTFGRKFGEMFRRVFYGDVPPAGYGQPAPQYQQPQYQQPPGRRDQPPPGYYQRPTAPPQYQQPPQQGYPPRYETPPAPRGTSSAMPPTSRMNSGSSGSTSTTKKSSSQSSKKASNSSTPGSAKYTPPAITRKPSQPRFEEESPPPMQRPATIQETPPSKLPGSKPGITQKESSAEDKPNAAASSGSFLRGKKTGKEGRVISPYPPYRELDVTGLSSGSLALDPTTQKVFEVP
jgi:hypothetical protein